MLDTSVLVAAVRSAGGASRLLLRAALASRFSLLASTTLFIEYEAVLCRPDQLSAAGATVDDICVLLDALAAVASPVRLSYLWRPILRDADDDMVVEAAVNGAADAIVTFNRRDFAPALDRFPLALLSPGEAVRMLGAKE